jgi:hypothetical protein
MNVVLVWFCRCVARGAHAICFDFHTTRRDVAPGGLRQGRAFDIAALGDG